MSTAFVSNKFTNSVVALFELLLYRTITSHELSQNNGENERESPKSEEIYLPAISSNTSLAGGAAPLNGIAGAPPCGGME